MLCISWIIKCSITQVVHLSYLVVQVGEVGLKRSRSLNLPGAKIKKKKLNSRSEFILNPHQHNQKSVSLHR